jgi:GxxExxY protein
MPIAISTEIQVFSQQEFHAVDRRVMGVVFEVHNEFGRLLEEELFKREIAARCAEIGIQPVEREVRIRVTHQDFAKDYSMDLLFCHGMMLEAKAAEALAPAHRNQTLNYLFLSGMSHARLVNLRTELVQYEFVSTRLTPELRHRFTVVDQEWEAVNEKSKWLHAKLFELLSDWGAFLDGGLYRDALIHFLGGMASVNKPVEVFSGSRCLGVQKLNLLDEQTAFALTTLQSDSEPMRENLERLLRHTHLEFVQWINFNRHQIECVTLSKAMTKSCLTKS